VSSDQRRHTAEVRQVIKGEGHQIAGNDIHNHTRIEEYDPPADSPYLQPCKACGWRGVAVNASECRKCGYNYALDRAMAAERSRRETEQFFFLVGMTILVIVIGTNLTTHATSLGFLDAIAVCGVAAVAAWGGWFWLSAWWSVKLKRFRKGRGE
tara:strand:+ start:491 stop:952 length:462 start_codon:yes stop_codon:yes gene_type:complete